MSEWEEVHPGIHLFADPLSNVYLLKDGRFGILVEAGSGAVFDRLPEIGVDRIDMVLLTHHHRDVSAGVWRSQQAKVLLPQGEARFLADAEDFWKSWKIYVRYDLANNTNTPTVGREVEALSAGRVIEWRNWTIECVHLPGHTPHSFGYLVQFGDNPPAMLTGDMVADASGTVWSIHDLHWDYMPPPKGIEAALEGAIPAVQKRNPAVLLPSHGAPIRRPGEALTRLAENLAGLQKHLAPNREPRTDDTPREILPHLIYLGATSYLILSDSGKGFVYDWGYADFKVLEQARSRWGCEEIEAVSISHYHEDHVARMNELFYSAERSYWQKKPEVWVHEVQQDILANPSAYDMPCLWPGPIKADRTFRDGEKGEWREYVLEFFHMPGQTYYHQGMAVDIDGKRCLFSGDNLWRPRAGGGLPNGPLIPRNVYLPEHGYPYISEMLEKYDPDIIVPSHYEPFEATDEYLDGFKEWAEGIWPRIEALAGAERRDMALNPHWVRAHPYLSTAAPGDETRIEVRIRNPFRERRRFRCALLGEAAWRRALLSGPPPGAAEVEIAPGREANAPFDVIKRGEAKREVLLIEVWVEGAPQGAPAVAIIDAP